MAGTDGPFYPPVLQQELHRPVQRRLPVEPVRKAEGVQRHQGGVGVGIRRFRTAAEAELQAAPAAVGTLGVQQVPPGSLQPGVAGIPQMAEQIGRMDGLAGIDATLGIHLKAPVLLPDAEKQRGDLMHKRITGLHSQLQQVQRTFQRGKRGALEQPLIRRGPQIAAVIPSVGQNRLRVCPIRLFHSHGISLFPATFSQSVPQTGGSDNRRG